MRKLFIFDHSTEHMGLVPRLCCDSREAARPYRPYPLFSETYQGLLELKEGANASARSTSYDLWDPTCHRT